MSKRSGLMEKSKSFLSALKPIRPILAMRIALTVMSPVLLALSPYSTCTFRQNSSYWDETVRIGSETTKRVKIGFL